MTIEYAVSGQPFVVRTSVGEGFLHQTAARPRGGVKVTKKERERIEERLRRLQQYLASPARVRPSGPSRKEMDAAREFADIQRQLEAGREEG
jgi:Ribonuclease G/E